LEDNLTDIKIEKTNLDKIIKFLEAVEEARDQLINEKKVIKSLKKVPKLSLK
jgi:uncharacterized protein YktA (UPF0223 family)